MPPAPHHGPPFRIHHQSVVAPYAGRAGAIRSRDLTVAPRSGRCVRGAGKAVSLLLSMCVHDNKVVAPYRAQVTPE